MTSSDVPSSESDSSGWPPIRPLEGAPLPAFPSGVLPDWLREWVDAQSLALQVPTELPALLALTVLATAVARRFEMRVRPGWIEPLNLYALIALPSGARKSVVFEAATAPLLAYETEAALRATVAAGSIEDEDTIDGGLRLVVDGAPYDPSKRRRRRPPSAMISPTRAFVSDATPERVASLLAENGGRIAVLSDEGEICSIIAGRYGGSFEIFLKGHSGQVLTIERQGRPRVHVRRPSLTLGLAVQPDVLRMLAAKRLVRERGLLARFLVAIPASNIGRRTIAPPPVVESIANAYAERVRTLLQHNDARDELGELETRSLEFSSAAHQAFTAFETEIEAMLGSGGVLHGLSSWGAKLPGATARLAAILWLATHPVDPPCEIDEETALDAIAIGRFAIPHARAAFEEMGVDKALAGAKAIAEWMQGARREEFTQRELHQVLRRRFPTVRDLEEALNVLEEHGHLRRVEDDAHRGRPSKRYAVHPSLTGWAG